MSRNLKGRYSRIREACPRCGNNTGGYFWHGGVRVHRVGGRLRSRPELVTTGWRMSARSRRAVGSTYVKRIRTYVDHKGETVEYETNETYKTQSSDPYRGGVTKTTTYPVRERPPTVRLYRLSAPWARERCTHPWHEYNQPTPTEPSINRIPTTRPTRTEVEARRKAKARLHKARQASR